MGNKEKLQELYEKVLIDYVEERTERGEHKAQLLSKKILKNRISPEELSNWQKNVIERWYPDLPEEVTKIFDFYSEIIKSYGVVLEEMDKLRQKQQQICSEMEVAASVQSSLLKYSIPEMDGLEIGAVSIPARKVSGDYFHFAPYENGSLGIGIADVMGKGLPAALCISMIKCAIEQISGCESIPNLLLAKLNEKVEGNVDVNMFVSMLYGLYEPASNRFLYASAGHEPALYYNAKSDNFEEMNTKGLLLGVNKQTQYQLYEKSVEIDDLLIFVTDGVTESRIDGEFIKKEFLLEEFRKNIHLHPQDLVMKVCRHLLKLQHFKLRDDFTLIVLKRVG